MAEQLPMPIRRWIIQLGKLSATNISSDEAADYVQAIEPMLAIHFPPAAFTLDSLESVASECKYLPTYGEICQHLGAWWQYRKPRPAAISREPARRAEPTAEERAHVAWAANQAAADLRSVAQPVEERRRPTPRHLTQEQLVRAYKAAGVEPPKRSA